jgi:protein-L-isoaspartate(D-aspartate) O-methyltransferase
MTSDDDDVMDDSAARAPSPDADAESAAAAARFAEQRVRMVERQLAARGIRDGRVLSAMGEVPREEFVPQSLRSSAYDDGALPIGQGQTISQPFTVAFMCEALHVQPDDTILEVGTGSGYGAAVLSRIARMVHTVERIPELADGARQRLQRLGYHNVTVHLANGSLGVPQAAPFDGIIVTAGAERLPQAYLEQLAEGGRILIPLGRTPHSQSMFRFTRRDGELAVDNLGGFLFVPLIGEEGWQPSDLSDASDAP